MTMQDIIIWLATTALLAAGCLFGLSAITDERLLWLPFVMVLLTILLPCFMLAWLLLRSGGTSARQRTGS